MTSAALETERGRIEYTRRGEGPVALIVHGGNGNCYTDVRQSTLIDNGFSVLVPSRPGYGKTPRCLGRTAGEQAEVLKRLIDGLSIDGVSLIAVSAGGPTGLEFAKRYPDLCDCLVLEEAVSKTWIPRLSPQYWAMKYIFDPRRQARLWESQRRELSENPERHLIKLARRFSTLEPGKVLEDWDGEDRRFYARMLDSFEADSGFVFTMDHRASELETIGVPTLIIHSRFDRNVPFSHARYAHEMIKGSALWAAPTLSHLLYMGSRKNEVLERRLEFLAGSCSRR